MKQTLKEVQIPKIKNISNEEDKVFGKVKSQKEEKPSKKEKILELKEAKKIEKEPKQKKAKNPKPTTIDNYQYEKELWAQGINLIAGVDEVGRGPLIGPVVAAAVILPHDFYLEGLTDSKKLSEKKREAFYQIIKEKALAIGVGVISEKRIDEINIYEATKEAMKTAINNLNPKPDHILIDAMPLDLSIPTTSIIKGDLLSVTISAASVIAKVTRDHMLYEIDKEYPMYDLKNNKGYGTKKHLEALQEYGITKYHRLSFKPVADNSNKINQ